jgi:hypothetical protein
MSLGGVASNWYRTLYSNPPRNRRPTHTHHAPNALVPLPLNAVGDIDNNEWHPAGQDGLEGGGAQRPPTATAIVINVIVVNDGGGGVGADNRCPMPHAVK